MSTAHGCQRGLLMAANGETEVGACFDQVRETEGDGHVARRIVGPLPGVIAQHLVSLQVTP